MTKAAGMNKFYASVGGTTLVEYVEQTYLAFTWTKSYTYLGDSQLSTIAPNGTNAETIEYDHPDRLGNKLKTNPTTGAVSEQATLPFGRPLNAETTQNLTTNNKRFTSYDRSAATGLDYAVNRTYDSKQGRFTQVDPIGMESTDLNDPQSFNLYTYCGNDPINHTDPDGLFFGRLFKWIGKHLKKIMAVVAVVLAVVALATFPWAAPFAWKAVLGLVSSLASAVSSVADLAGLKTLSKVFGFIALAAGIAALGIEIKSQWNKHFGKSSKIDFENLIASTNPEDIIINGGHLADVTTKISFWDQAVGFLRKVGNITIALDRGILDALTFGNTGDLLARNYPGSEAYPEVYTGGYACATAASLAVPGAGALRGAKIGAQVYRGTRGFKLAIHPAHHRFGRLGKLAHIQLNSWLKGVSGSTYAKRIPLPSRKMFKEKIICKK